MARLQQVGILLAAMAVAGAAVAAPPTDVEGAIRTRLMDYQPDPLAAQIAITKGPWRDADDTFGQTEEGEFVCARVNNKNRLGAYTGFKPHLFIFKDDGEVAVIEALSHRELDVLVAKCGAGVFR